MKRISAKESQEKWEFLEKRAKRNSSEKPSEATNDVFDCSDLVVPSNKDLVDGVLEDYINEWKKLDERKVLVRVQHPRHAKKAKTENHDDSNDQQEENAPLHRLPTWGWHANRLRLPDKFDYASRRTSPPVSEGAGDKVVSLDNPMNHVSYETELWNLFRSVPTVQEVEDQAMEGATCHRIRKLQREMTDTLKKNTRLDGHALSRMRHRDRHGLPPPAAKKPDDSSSPLVSTVRIECWRRQLKRGSSPDAHRMELEFLGSQTLLDVHAAIVELHQDDLWTNDSSELSSGLFFIEDEFYTTGPVDYATPILKWLDEDPPDATKEQVTLSRRYFLGISPGDSIKTTSMTSVRLDQLKIRLGVRYYHVCNGDVECSVFITDVRHTRQRQQEYPIVHDIWTPNYPMVECEACQRLVAALVVPPGHDMTHGGATALCHSCCGQFIKNDSTSVPQMTPYNVYREQSDLSVGHDEAATKTLF